MPRGPRLDARRVIRGGDGQRGSAGGRRFRAPCKASHRAGSLFVCASGRGGASGPGLWRTCRARCGPRAVTPQGAGITQERAQGPCRNSRPKHLPRIESGPAAGATRAEGPEEGRVDKPTSVSCEASACRVGTPSGEFRAARCQRHPLPMPADTRHGQLHTFRRHGLRAALRTAIPANPGGICRAAMRPAVSTMRARATGPWFRHPWPPSQGSIP